MNERVKFIARYLENEEPFATLCEAAGVSRKAGYKWVERYDSRYLLRCQALKRPGFAHTRLVLRPAVVPLPEAGSGVFSSPAGDARVHFGYP
jgi:hypothetical protein